MNNHANSYGVEWFSGKLRTEYNNEHCVGVWWMVKLVFWSITCFILNNLHLNIKMSNKQQYTVT